MSPDFAILLAVAAASAWGAGAAMKGEGKATKLLAVLVYVVVGTQVVLFAMLSGDGRILPGRQLNPAVHRYWLEVLGAENAFAPEAAYCLAALLGHALAALPRPTRRALLRPLPATIVFVVLFFVLKGREDGAAIPHHRSDGPDGVAWLTIAPAEKGVRLVLSTGRDEDSFLRVRHVHTAASAPPEPRLHWTKDGKGIVLFVRNRKLFAVDVETGATTGALPEARHEWPREQPAAESTDTRRRFSQAQRDVAEFVVNHGGIYVP